MAVIRGSAVRVVVVALILFGQTSAAQASPGARHVGSIADLLQQAEAGNAQAQYELGIHYYDGAGVPKDSANALKCFRKAADQDHALAQLALGRFYREGRLGLEKNPQEAVAWFRKAAEQGDAWGQSELALMYELGEGVAQDSAEAVRWYARAADQALPVAQFDLAYMYANGKGVPADAERAVRLYEPSAVSVPVARFNLASL